MSTNCWKTYSTSSEFLPNIPGESCSLVVEHQCSFCVSKPQFIPQSTWKPRSTDEARCIPLPEWTGTDIINGTFYRNGHSLAVLGALDAFYLLKMYFCSHMNSLLKIIFISVYYSKIDFPGWSG